MPEEKVRRFGDYVLKQASGQGGMGAVYLAEDTARHRMVALKVLGASIGLNAEYVRRFLTEARLASQLHHPSIVDVYDYGRERGHYYLAMERIDGPSVKARIINEGRIAWPEAIDIALHVARGLRSAYRQGVIHRDIKPENILIDAHGRARIADLGLAKEMDAIEPLPSDTSLGTPDYMSPEQVSNSETVDFRSDIYSLGATLFHMLCGRAPYTGRSAYEVMVKHVSAELPSPLKYVPELPAPIRDVMRKMMARDPDDRYATYDELISDLQALLEGKPVKAAEFDDESMLSSNGSAQAAVAPGAGRVVWAALAGATLVGSVGVLLYLLSTA
jgi:serine/threonine protein kinase